MIQTHHNLELADILAAQWSKLLSKPIHISVLKLPINNKEIKYLYLNDPFYKRSLKTQLLDVADKEDSNAKVIGIGVGVSLAVIIILVIITLFLKRFKVK